MGNFLAFANQKGGVGKTTTSATIGAIFAEKGLRTLVIDNDPQGNASQQLGVAKADLRELSSSLSDVYLGRKGISEIALATTYDNLFLAPAAPTLSEVEINLPAMPGSDLRLKKALEQERGEWDIVVMDNPPNLGKLSINSLIAADWFVIPMDAVWGLDAVGDVITVVKTNSGYYGTNNRLLGILLTLTDNTNVTRAVRDEAYERYADYVLKSEIRRAKQGREAAALGQPVTIYAPKSDLASDYYSLAAEIAGKMGISF